MARRPANAENTEEGEMSLRYAEVEPNGSTVGEVILDKRTCQCCTTTVACARLLDNTVTFADRTESRRLQRLVPPT